MRGLDRLVDRGSIATDVPLGALTTYRLGGAAELFADITNLSELEVVISGLEDEPVLVLGRGSNLVISDSGFAGLVIRLGGSFEDITCGDAEVVAGGAAWLPAVARMSVDHGLRGLEFFVGIPGSVGGAVRQNAGGHGSETRDWLTDVDVMSVRTGVVQTRTVDDLEMSYRHTNIAADDLVISAKFGAHPGPMDEGRDLIASIVRWRKQHQPSAVYNAGSVFRNPEGDSAGRIIDSLGLKGMSVGGVSVSHKHANFFVSSPKASATDLFRLVRRIQQTVRDRANVDLIPEIQFVGDFDE